MFERVIEAAEAATTTDSPSGADVEYHLARARAERNIAYRSADACVADAHMRLSALHLQHALMLRTRQGAPVGNAHPFRSSTDGSEPSAVSLPILRWPSTRRAGESAAEDRLGSGTTHRNQVFASPLNKGIRRANSYAYSDRDRACSGRVQQD